MCSLIELSNFINEAKDRDKEKIIDTPYKSDIIPWSHQIKGDLCSIELWRTKKINNPIFNSSVQYLMSIVRFVDNKELSKFLYNTYYQFRYESIEIKYTKNDIMKRYNEDDIRSETILYESIGKYNGPYISDFFAWLNKSFEYLVFTIRLIDYGEGNPNSWIDTINIIINDSIINIWIDTDQSRGSQIDAIKDPILKINSIVLEMNPQQYLKELVKLLDIYLVTIHITKIVLGYYSV